MSRRTPLGKALGLGSAKDGTQHWWMQRLTAVALVPLALWFVVSLTLLGAADAVSHAAVSAWLARPLNTVLAVLLLGTLAQHSQLGVQVVIEDYVRADGLKLLCLVAQKFAHYGLAAAGIFAVLRIGLGSAG